MSKLKFGVPCSKIKDCIKDVEIPCSTEEEAMSIAAGAWLAGKERLGFSGSFFGSFFDALAFPGFNVLCF